MKEVKNGNNDCRHNNKQRTLKSQHAAEKNNL